MPKPRQEGGVPIWVSGTVNKRSARRLARFGSGWIPWGADAGNLVESIPDDAGPGRGRGRRPVVRRWSATPRRCATRRAPSTWPPPSGGAAPLVEAGVTDCASALPPVDNYDDDLAIYQGVVKAFPRRPALTP